MGKNEIGRQYVAAAAEIGRPSKTRAKLNTHVYCNQFLKEDEHMNAFILKELIISRAYDSSTPRKIGMSQAQICVARSERRNSGDDSIVTGCGRPPGPVGIAEVDRD